ncbi:transcriptional regulator, TetR family [Stigmatella aurantiaca]|uniref:Transcriptional regulator, TetR family n=1 Tax=Stigmatella aurantiaca TaxID=41 RepID=A0A1H7FR30_STIAU|nr:MULTISPECIES: TetR/AcrR family transcriptional regulator [Stigmatella]SEK25805.1 transcriptional regulator, TetR family [Stigmatella aurantiaca]
MNQKTEQKLKSREAILASAAALLRERGIRASSVSDVMKGAGLTVGGFYNHFDSKEDLFAATIRSSASIMWNKLLATAKGESPRERVMSVLGRYLSRTHRDNAEPGCLLPNTVPEASREGEPYLSALEAELAGFVKSLSELLSEGSGRREKAVGLIALMYGALSLARAVRGTPLSDEFLQAAKRLAERSLAED